MKKYNKITLLILLIFFGITLVSCKKEKNEKDIFDEIYESIVLPEETTSDLNLPVTSSLNSDAKLYWTSNNFSVISHEGMLKRPDEDTKVGLDLLITIGIETRHFEYEVTALGWENKKLPKDTFKDPQGFASLGITSRKGSEVLTANSELEFLDHLIDTQNQKNVVIKITKDLNLGARYIGDLLVKQGLWDGVNPKNTPYLDGKVFRENTNLPDKHPRLIKNGVGQLIIDGRDGLMIYSDEGYTIDHLTINIKGNSKDIVFRNLRFKGIWEWDEIDRGDYKALDWDYFTIEQAENIWLDHLTFKTSYDGIVDIKGNVKNVTLSWLNLDFTVDDFITEQFDWLEENLDKNPFYRELREKEEVLREEIEIVAAGQKKAFNWGNTEGGPGFEEITVTMHHVYAKNLQDRFPRLRRGDVHLYNVVLDSEEIQKLKDINMKVISQGLIPTEQGSILMENSKFIGVREPIKTHQSSNLDPDFTGKFMVKDSEYIYQDRYYYGSSTDVSYENPWKKANSNISHVLEFYFRNYQNVPYEYQMQDSNQLTKVFKDNYLGAGKIEDFDWLDIINLIDVNDINKGSRIDENRIEGLDDYITTIGNKIPQFKPTIYNYYTGKQLRDFEYNYYVNTSEVNTNVAGIYQVEHIFVLENDSREVKYIQEYIVYDVNGPNEIYDFTINTPFDNNLSLELSLYEPNGHLYYYLSNDKTESVSTIKELGEKLLINNTKILLTNIDITDFKYIHFITSNNDNDSKVVSEEIIKENVIEIKTSLDFNRMLATLNSKGNYYKLMNDIDFTNVTLPGLTADFIFEGVFDGQGFTLKNINRHAYGGGIWHTIGNGMIKNVVFQNVVVDIHETDIIDSETGEVTGTQKSSARSGIVAGQIKGGTGVLENITIINSKVMTDNNYGAILVGKVEGNSGAIIRNIKVINSEVDQEGEYAGGLIAGIENNTQTLIEDIYINGLTIYEGKDKMIGVIVGRLSTGTTINRVVAININVKTNAAIGGALGKDDRKGQDVDVYLNDIFININEIIGGNHYLGNIIGNPDVNQGHRSPITSNIWGTEVATGSSGVSATLEHTVLLEELTETYWNDNFKNMINSNLWEVKDDLLQLKR